MAHPEVKLALAFVMAIVLSVFGAWWLAYRYRAAMRRLMSAPLADAAPVVQALAVELAPPMAAHPITAAGNRRAAWRLTWLLCALSLAMSVSVAALQHTILFGSSGYSSKRVAVLVLVQMWPVVPVLGLVWRWSRRRVAAVLALWFAVSFLVLLWRSYTPEPGALLVFLAIEIGPPMVLIAALFLSHVTRAIAPWLLPLTFGFAFASIAGTELLVFLAGRNSPWLKALLGELGAHAVMALAVVLPWFLAWWPLRRLGRALGRAYARKQVSELGMLLTAVWGISLLYQWLGMVPEGAASAWLLLPMAWIALALYAGWRLTRQASRAPTLLVLRVFQHDAQVQELFDMVIERWRLSGNTMLIAGTDLIDRTLGADEVFAFLDGRLAARFVRVPQDVAARVAAFDLQRDHDGRYRVNECYCHDTTWQAALAALVRSSDVVLMDLRGFQARNAGCSHELGVLARAPRIARVVVLVDAGTDRAAADAAVAGAPAGRFVWLDTPRIDRRHARSVLEQLFVATPAEAGPSGCRVSE